MVSSILILLSTLCLANVIALRLYPSVPRNMKVAVQDDIWPGTQPHFQLQKQRGRHISIEHSQPNSSFFSIAFRWYKDIQGRVCELEHMDDGSQYSHLGP